MDGGGARVEVLGPFRVCGGSSDDHLGGGLAAALVALLAVRLGRPVDRDDLISALWSTPRDDAGPALRQLVARARRVLPDGAIERVETGGRTAYRLSSDLVAVDLAEFERLVGAVRRSTGRDGVDAALDLVRGTPFSGLPNLDVFDDARRAAESQIAELERARLIADAEACRPSLLPALDTALDAHPDDEALWIAKVRYFARTSRPAAAARAAAAARRTLGEVGIEPGPALRDAERLALDLGSMSLFTPGTLPPPPDVVGRVAARTEATTALLDGRTRVVTLWGGPGMGTSTLLAAVVNDLVAAGVTVALVAAPADADSTRSTGPTELVERLVSRLGWTAEDGDPARWMSVVVPTDAVLALDVFGPPDEFVGALQTITGGWPGPVVIAAGRPTGLPGEHAIRLSALAHHDAVELLRRRTAALRGRPLPDTELGALQEICERSGGIPLVIELVAHQLATCSTTDLLVGPMPSGLAERIDAIVGRLSEVERDVLHRIVWIGGPFDLLDAHRAFVRPRPAFDVVRAALGSLVEAGLVLFEDERPTSSYRMLAPVTAVIRDGDAAAVMRRSAMRRRGITLAGRGRCWAARLGRPGEEAARTMLLGRLPELSETARDPTLPAWIRPSLVRACVEVLVTVGRAADARRLLDEAITTEDDFVRYAHDLVIVSYWGDDHREVVELARRARAGKIRSGDSVVIGTTAVRSLRTLGRFEEAHGLLDELTRTVLPGNDLDRASLRLERGMVLVHEANCGAAASALAEARIDFEALGVTRGVGACDVYLAWCAFVDGVRDHADQLLGRAWAVATSLGHTADEMFCRGTAARFAVERGRYERALDDCRVVEAFVRSARDQLALARILEVRAAAERALGRSGEDAAFEAALVRSRIDAPLSPFEHRWTDGARRLTVAGR